MYQETMGLTELKRDVGTLRPYQEEALAEVSRGFRQGRKRVVLCAATGAGKTMIALHMALRATERGKRVWFVADRRVLVEQTRSVFQAAFPELGVLMGGDTVRADAQVCIASAQTLKARRMFDNGPLPELVIVDEIHEQHAYVNRSLVDHDLYGVGLSATPFDDSLKDTWHETVVNVQTTKRLCDDGYLMLPRVIEDAGVQVDTSGVKVNGGTGEWVASALDERVQRVVVNAVGLWEDHVRAHGSMLPTLVFTPSIDSAEQTRQTFRDAGHEFGLVHSGRDEEDNRDTIRRFRAGETQGVVNVNVLTKGFDAPHSALLLDLQPVRSSLSRHIQKLGRIMRPSPGKPKPVYFDLSGNWSRFRSRTLLFWMEGHQWDEPKGKGDGVAPTKECPVCGGEVPLGARVCSLPVWPHLEPCGHEFPPPPVERIQVHKDDLREVDVAALMDEDVDDLTEEELWPEIVRYASIRGRGNLVQSIRIANGAWKGWTGRWLTARQKDNFQIEFGEVRPAVEMRLKAQYKDFLRRGR